MQNKISSDGLFETLKIPKSIISSLNFNGFTTMTKIQQQTIPKSLEKKDIVVQSHTGSGKTLCFVIPTILEALKKPNTITGLVISPTRELAIQIDEVFKKFNIKTCCFIGGIDLKGDLEAIKDCNVVVGTPGRLFEIVKNNTKLFSKLSSLVLDEADELVSLGFSEKVLDLISCLPKNRTTSLFSATLSDGVKKLSLSLLKNPIFIANEILETPEELKLNYLIVKPEDKLSTALKLIKGKKSIVFFSTCNQVDFFHSLCNNLDELKNKLLKIHGKMKQEERSTLYNAFNEPEMVLFCTDVAARGIDFKGIELIIHFDIPKDYKNIIHRSGRTARNGELGEAILFVMPSEKVYVDFLKVKEIEIEEFSCEKEDVSSSLRDFMDPEMLDLSVKAFVSYIRSYKEHTLNYILDFSMLDFDSLAELFMLIKIPGMHELKNIEFKKFQKPLYASKKEKIKKEKPRKNIKVSNREQLVVKQVEIRKQKHQKKRIKSKKDLKRRK